MSPAAMGDFIIPLMKHFGLKRAHVVAPDVGTLAFLFAASARPDLFESLVIGGGAVRAELAAGQLKDIIHSAPGGCPLLNTAIAADDGSPVLRKRARKAPASVAGSAFGDRQGRN